MGKVHLEPTSCTGVADGGGKGKGTYGFGTTAACLAYSAIQGFPLSCTFDKEKKNKYYLIVGLAFSTNSKLL